MWLTLTLAAVAAWLLLCLLRDVYSHWLRRGVTQLKHTSLLFGNAGSLFLKRTPMADLCSDIYRQLKGHRFGGFYLITKPCFMILDPDLVYRVRTWDAAYFHERGTCLNCKGADPLLRHMFLMDAGCLRELRRKLRTALSEEKTRSMFFLLDKCCRRVLRRAGSITPCDVELGAAFTRFTTDVIGCCAFGIECGAIDDPNSQFARIAEQVFRLSKRQTVCSCLHMALPRLSLLLGVRYFPAELQEFFTRVVRETKQHRRDNGIFRDDIIDLLLQINNSDKGSLPDVTDDAVVSQVFLFFVVGFSMTSLVLSHCAFELAHHPAAQTRARLEVDAVLRRHVGNLSYDAVQEMGYLDMVLAETLRLHPPLGMYCRECTSSYRVPGSDVILQPGDTACISVAGLHRDAQFWSDPLAFDPDRFGTDRPQPRRGTYLPFGNGFRTCVGKHFAMVEMKAVLATLLSQYEFRPSPRTPHRPIDAATEELWVRISQRTWIACD